MPSKAITVAVVEDDPSNQAAIRAALALDTSFELVFMSELGQTMCDWLSQSALANTDSLAVDILVADIGLPDISGVDVVRHCHYISPNTHILVCTLFDDDEHLFASLESGAQAYVLKEYLHGMLVSALHELRSGGSPMSPTIARKVLKKLTHSAKASAPVLDPAAPKLSARELELLNLLARGFRYAEIATIAFISVNTVQTHIKNIYFKLQVNSKNEAVYEATRMGMIDVHKRA